MNLSAVDRQQWTFDAVPESARAARRFVGEILRLRGAPEAIIRDFELVVSELVANVIEHGGGSGLTVFSDFSDRQWWDIGVVGEKTISENQMTHPDAWRVAGSEHASGRGLGIVRQLMDDVVTDTTDGQVSVRCRRARS